MAAAEETRTRTPDAVRRARREAELGPSQVRFRVAWLLGWCPACTMMGPKHLPLLSRTLSTLCRGWLCSSSACLVVTAQGHGSSACTGVRR